LTRRRANIFSHVFRSNVSSYDCEMKMTVQRVFTAFTVVAGAITIYQVMSKPMPVAAPQNVDGARVNAQSFDQKIAQLEAPRTEGSAPEEVHFTSEELSARLAQSMGTLPAHPVAKAVRTSPTPPDSDIGSGQVEVNGYQVQLVGDVARGQFMMQVAGQDI